MIPPGSIVDAGAYDGRTSCLYAALAPDRTVYAFEPVAANIPLIEKNTHGTKVRAHHIALGSIDRDAMWQTSRGKAKQGKSY